LVVTAYFTTPRRTGDDRRLAPSATAVFFPAPDTYNAANPLGRREMLHCTILVFAGRAPGAATCRGVVDILWCA
jgi:hypothetical protein